MDPNRAAAPAQPLDGASSPTLQYCIDHRLVAEKAAEHEGLDTVDVEINFNGDKLFDCVYEGYKSLYLFQRTDEAVVFLGEVPGEAVHGIGCTDVIDKNGFCRIYTGVFMIHGETQTEIFRLEGKRYVSTGEVTLSAPEPLP